MLCSLPIDDAELAIDFFMYVYRGVSNMMKRRMECKGLHNMRLDKKTVEILSNIQCRNSGTTMPDVQNLFAGMVLHDNHVLSPMRLGESPILSDERAEIRFCDYTCTGIQ